MNDEAQKIGKTNENDLPERITKFNEEIKPILGKYELGIGAQPHIAPDGRIGARAILVSMRGLDKSEKEQLIKT